MYPRPEDAPSATSRALLDYVLAALPASEVRTLGGNTGLPVGAVASRALDLVVAATPVMAPIFDDAASRYARLKACDVVLIRHGLAPETLGPVRVDLTVRLATVPLLFPDLAFFRYASGSLHLVSAQDDLFVSFGRHGLLVTSMIRWSNPAERSEGLERAATEIVRLCRAQRTG